MGKDKGTKGVHVTKGNTKERYFFFRLLSRGDACIYIFIYVQSSAVVMVVVVIVAVRMYVGGYCRF